MHTASDLDILRLRLQRLEAKYLSLFLADLQATRRDGIRAVQQSATRLKRPSYNGTMAGPGYHLRRHSRQCDACGSAGVDSVATSLSFSAWLTGSVMVLLLQLICGGKIFPL